MQRASVTGAMAVVVACILAPSVYTLLSIAGAAPMTVPIFLGWLGWLQAVHVVATVLIWPRRHGLSTRMKAALLSWGGLAFWYWLPAPIYFLLTMNLDQLQLQWTALAFFWEVPVVGGAFVLAAQQLYPSRRRVSNDPARRYRAVMRYPTLVGSVLLVFTLLGYVIGAPQLRVVAALPPVEQVKNVAHGLVISLLLAVFYYLGLDPVLEPVRSQIAREGGLGTIVARTVAGRIFGVSVAVAVSGFALISLFVLQAFQTMVADSTESLDVVSGQGQTLLVVEDEATVRQSLAHILGKLHAQRANDIALVLTDLVMPGMGGLNLVRRLRERGVPVPVVMMSGYVAESARGSVEGVAAWVQKPVRARRLGAVIQEALSSRV